MSDLFGDGIHLDEQFDFAVGTTGDLKSESGTDELQKDLAFQMVISLDKYIGQHPSGNLNEKVAGTARRVAEIDSRVNFVDTRKTEVSFSTDRQEITLKLFVKTDTGEKELIFDV
jgi:hypothetical protein